MPSPDDPQPASPRGVFLCLDGPDGGGQMPDLTVLIDVPPEVAQARVGPPRDRIEDRPEAFRRAVRAGFLEALKTYPSPFVVIDGSADPEAVADQIRSEVARVLGLDP